MRTPEQFGLWCEARGQRNVVLRVADVLRLRPAARVILADFAGVVAPPDDATAERSAWQQRGAAHRGLVAVPSVKLVRCTQAELVALQGALAEYVQTRQAHGYPVRRDDCPHCAAVGCKACSGQGYTETLIEMDDDERALSCSAAPQEPQEEVNHGP